MLASNSNCLKCHIYQERQREAERHTQRGRETEQTKMKTEQKLKNLTLGPVVTSDLPVLFPFPAQQPHLEMGAGEAQGGERTFPRGWGGGGWDHISPVESVFFPPPSQVPACGARAYFQGQFLDSKEEDHCHRMLKVKGTMTHLKYSGTVSRFYRAISKGHV